MRWWAARAVVVIAAALFVIGAFTLIPFGSQAGIYLADRDIGMAVLLSVLLAVRWTRALGAVLLATAAMHLVDGLGDLWLANLPAATGSLVVAGLSAVAAAHFLTEAREAPTG